MKQQHFTLIEVLVALAVFVMGIAPLLGLMAANSRQFQSDQTIFQEADVLYERMAEIRDKIYTFPAAFDDANHDLWVAEESDRYPGVYSVAEAFPVGEYGYHIVLGIGSDQKARDAILDANGDPVADPDPTHDDLRQHTMFVVERGDF
jgi:prepilin-type N-terminal cleavage/methylation domain-containing protein